MEKANRDCTGWGRGAVSRRTASMIQDDVSRSRTFASIRNEPADAKGGAAMADFDTLIELITSTVAPIPDAVGGPAPFSLFRRAFLLIPPAC